MAGVSGQGTIVLHAIVVRTKYAASKNTYLPTAHSWLELFYQTVHSVNAKDYTQE